MAREAVALSMADLVATLSQTPERLAVGGGTSAEVPAAGYGPNCPMYCTSVLTKECHCRVNMGGYPPPINRLTGQEIPVEDRC